MEAFYLDAPGPSAGRRLCVYHPAAPGPARGAFVYVHPFAEEMNKARRMASLQARALAAAGFAVLQIDLKGCGDSSGDFATASWDDWVDDVLLALHWMRARHGMPMWLWGLRCGCLVAAQAAQRYDGRLGLLFWQPTGSGQALLNQFLRLRLAAGLGADAPRSTVPDARAEWAAGRVVEVAGYAISPALAAGLERARLVLPPADGPCILLECNTREPPEPLQPTAQLAAAWRAARPDLFLGAVTGPAFWQTQEIEDAPALLVATLDAVTAAAAPCA